MYSSRKGIRSAKFAQKKKKKQLIYIAAIVLGVLLTIFGLLRLTYLSAIEIRDISITGNKITPAADIIKIIREKTKGGYLGVVSKNNIFLYPKGLIEDHILETIPRISSILISWESWHGIHVDIEERKPEGLFCKGQHQDELNAKVCYFVDENAVIFDEAPEFTPDVYTRYFFSTARIFPQLGQTIIEKEDFTAIAHFVNEVEKMKLLVDSVIMSSSGDFEVHIAHQSDGSSGVIYMDDRQPFSKTLENLQSFLEDSRVKGGSRQYRPIIYLDLRYGNNLYYKFK